MTQYLTPSHVHVNFWKDEKDHERQGWPDKIDAPKTDDKPVTSCIRDRETSQF